MVELVTSDGPDVICLQELPVWATTRLAGWSSMQVFSAVARRPLVPGPVPGWVTGLNHGRIRSAFVGQANAILVSSALDAVDLGWTRVSDEERERRIVQAVRVADRVVVANLHASQAGHGPAAAADEAQRSRAFAEGLARAGDTVVLAGDFNVLDPRLGEFSAPTAGVDHVLVKGATSLPPVAWPLERRTVDGVVLSDHAPVEVAIE